MGKNSKGNRLHNIYEVLGSSTHVIIFVFCFNGRTCVFSVGHYKDNVPQKNG